MQWGRQFRRVLRSTVVVIGGLVALLIVGTALFANSLAPNPPDEQNFDLVESAPGTKRSEERRVGKEWSGQWSTAHYTRRERESHKHGTDETRSNWRKR